MREKLEGVEEARGGGSSATKNNTTLVSLLTAIFVHRTRISQLFRSIAFGSLF